MLTLAALFFACSSADSADKASDDSGTAGVTDTADTTDSGTDTGPVETGDPLPTEAAVADVTWSLHPEIGAIGIITWTQTADADTAWVEYRVDGGDWSASPAQAGTAGTRFSHVLGVPYDTDVEVRVVNDFGDGGVVSEGTVGHTGALPDGIELPTLTTPLPGDLDPDTSFVLLGIGMGDASWKLILDRAGRVVWAHPSDGDTGSMQVSVDGRQILWDDGAAIVHRMTLDGAILETVDLPGLHHTFVEAVDNTLVWGGKEDSRDSVWERTTDGTIRRIFDCATWWEEHDASMPCDGNTLDWRAEDDSLLFSSDNENTVMHLDRGSGAVLHQWGQLDGSWAFADPDDTFWKQHSPRWTDDGHLMVSSWASQTDHTLLAREYALDEANAEITQVWSCDIESGIVADYSGEQRRLGNGNTLLNYGPGATLREYTPDCALAWELAWSEGTSVRKMTALADVAALYALMP